jgi:hypothetical protein
MVGCEGRGTDIEHEPWQVAVLNGLGKQGGHVGGLMGTTVGGASLGLV